jgi:hypothetical protein
VAGDIRQDGVDQKAPTFVYWPLLNKGGDPPAHPVATYAATVVLRRARPGRKASWAKFGTPFGP